MEQIRIIKEMRDRDVRDNGRSGDSVRPRYMVWENVPGAFSSNKGEDFRIVLEETAKVADKDAVIPMPDNGKWQTSGCILGDGWSIAWRVLDAQFWGVPQRRRRIALVADFGGESAPEILFVRKGVSGHSQPSESERKTVAHNAEGSVGADDKAYTMKIRSGCDVDANGKAAGKGALIQTEQSGTLSCVQDQYLFQPVGFDAYNQAVTGGVAKSLTAIKSDTDHTPVVIQPLGADQYNAVILGDSVSTLGVNCGMSHGRQCVLEPVYSVENHPADSRVDIDESGKVQTLTSRMGTGGGNVPMVMQSEAVIALDRAAYNQGQNAQFDFDVNDGGIASTIVAKGPSAVCYWDGGQTIGTLTANNAGGNQRMPDKDNFNCVIENRTRYIVRRLTPKECEALQGYPSGWTDIGEYTDTNGRKKQSSDAARYKALGNSIALPPWKWVMKRLCACYERDATLASLFDGIGGFPYIWEQINGKGSCLWASEIEEFPMAVTKVRIGE